MGKLSSTVVGVLACPVFFRDEQVADPLTEAKDGEEDRHDERPAQEDTGEEVNHPATRLTEIDVMRSDPTQEGGEQERDCL